MTDRRPPADEALARRLRAAGADPTGDPAAVWRRLFAAEGLRATLIDRYEIEAAARGVTVDDLPAAERHRLSGEVLAARYPGIELHGSSGGDPVEVVPFDEAWAVSFEAWRSRLAGALGAVALRIEHVGSTAVPGLPAKPVVDVQVSVSDTGDEAAYRGTIEGLGLPLRAREPGHRYFRPAPGVPRDVQVHVCDAGGAWERAHLLFRDYLRADPATRDAYGDLKRSLAVRYRDDRVAYNEAKTSFVLDALERAEEWAERTGWSAP
jgi:GrpB-like predicted nucleotidyltransferase (UPF0157 family)